MMVMMMMISIMVAVPKCSLAQDMSLSQQNIFGAGK
jgi:hypothetical protein